MVTLTAMYDGQANSPPALLTSDITNSATSIAVDDGTILPAATTWLTLGADTEEAETVLLTGKTGNTLTVTRAQQGTAAKAWGVGTKVQRCFTAEDHNVLIDNIGALNTGKAESSHAASHKTGGDDALTPGDIGAQAAITASGILKGNGSTVGAAVSGTDYAAPGDIPSAYTSNPAMDGTASAGSSTAWAKGDHVHPSDTAKLDKTIDIVTISANTTLSSAHNGKHLVCTNSSAITITIPSGLGAGFNCTSERWGAGDVNLTPSSVTLNGDTASVTLGDQYEAAVSIIAVQANVFSVKGGLA